MGIDTEIGTVFSRRKGRVIRHIEKHQDIPMDYWYYDTETGREFDVRELPEKYFGKDAEAVRDGDREAHRRAIRRAMDDNHDFLRPKH